MTTDRHLALMALMTEIQAPANAYRHAVSRAAATLTDSPENLAAIDRGAAALDDIEAAVRLWVDSNRPMPLPGKCGVPSPDDRFVCALEPHTNAEMHSDRPLAAITPNGRRMVWETPTVLPDGFDRRSGVAVKCTACGYGFDEDEFIHFFDSTEEAVSTVTGTGWDELNDGRVLCETSDEKHDALRNEVGVVDQDAP